MPLDGTGFNPAAYVPVLTPAYTERWSVAVGKVPVPRQIIPRSDADALLHIWRMLSTNWSRLYNDGDNHCIVGWVGQTCSPLTITYFDKGQVKRLLQRLHDALPKSAQRKWAAPELVLARYNDTHSLPTIRAVVQRAYLAEVNASIDTLNKPTDT